MFSKTSPFLPLLALRFCIRETIASSLVVQTTSGQVQGRLASGTTNDVEEYLGIPYVSHFNPSKHKKFMTNSPQAQPPVGQLRWAPPEPFNGSSVIDATNFVSIFETASNWSIF